MNLACMIFNAMLWWTARVSVVLQLLADLAEFLLAAMSLAMAFSDFRGSVMRHQNDRKTLVEGSRRVGLHLASTRDKLFEQPSIARRQVQNVIR